MTWFHYYFRFPVLRHACVFASSSTNDTHITPPPRRRPVTNCGLCVEKYGRECRGEPSACALGIFRVWRTWGGGVPSGRSSVPPRHDMGQARHTLANSMKFWPYKQTKAMWASEQIWKIWGIFAYKCPEKEKHVFSSNVLFCICCNSLFVTMANKKSPNSFEVPKFSG